MFFFSRAQGHDQYAAMDIAEFQGSHYAISLAVRATLKAVDLVVLLRSRVVLERRPGALLLHLEAAEADANVAHLAPVLPPAVAHDPVLPGSVVLAPADDGDDVVRHAEEVQLRVHAAR